MRCTMRGAVGGFIAEVDATKNLFLIFRSTYSIEISLPVLSGMNAADIRLTTTHAATADEAAALSTRAGGVHA
jgi:hypothetical protein